MQTIRKSLQNQGISPEATDIILASWREGRMRQYETYAKQFITFCNKKEVIPLNWM